MKQLLILVCLVFGAVNLGYGACRIEVSEPGATTEIGMQSDDDSDAEFSVGDFLQRSTAAVKDFFANHSVWTIILLVVAVIVGVLLCLAIGFILLYYSIRCLVHIIIFTTDI